MRAVDEHTRELLQRTEGLDSEMLFSLHGRLTGGSPEVPSIEGIPSLSVGSKVRLHPKHGKRSASERSDIFDTVLEGMTATIELIEQDFEDKTHLAVTIDEDPGRDLGCIGMPGHRFFFKVDEVELMKPQTLVAGIGNIFHADDGFGVEVAKRMSGRQKKDGVQVVDFGIRGLDFAYTLLEGDFDAVIIVDIISRGKPPGTLYVIEPKIATIPTIVLPFMFGTRASDLNDAAEVLKAGYILESAIGSPNQDLKERFDKFYEAVMRRKKVPRHIDQDYVAKVLSHIYRHGRTNGFCNVLLKAGFTLDKLIRVFYADQTFQRDQWLAEDDWNHKGSTNDLDEGGTFVNRWQPSGEGWISQGNIETLDNVGNFANQWLLPKDSSNRPANTERLDEGSNAFENSRESTQLLSATDLLKHFGSKTLYWDQNDPELLDQKFTRALDRDELRLVVFRNAAEVSDFIGKVPSFDLVKRWAAAGILLQFKNASFDALALFADYIEPFSAALNNHGIMFLDVCDLNTKDWSKMMKSGPVKSLLTNSKNLLSHLNIVTHQSL